MKKALWLMCIFALSLSLLAGCGSRKAPATPVPETPPAQTEQQDSPNQQNTDFYSVCTNFSKSEVEQFAQEVKELILTANWSALSQRIAYPITMDGVAYHDSASFVKAPFETLLDTAAIEAIQNEDCTDMFCKYSGIMMGNGEVWIGEPLNEDGTSAGLRVISLSLLKQPQVFQAGTWLVQGKDTASYSFFDADGSSGWTPSLETGMGLGFTYTVDGETVLFRMGSADSEVKGKLSVTDMSNAAIIWEDGREETMRFVSEQGSDEFRFYSNAELCERAVTYYTEATGEAAPQAAADTEPETVTIQLYNNLGDHNSTCAWYQVNRLTGKGIDVNSGQEIDLSATGQTDGVVSHG